MIELSSIHPSRNSYRWNLLRTILHHENDGWWIRCNWAPLQYTKFDPLFGIIDLLTIVTKVLVSLVWCNHEWETISTNPKEPKMCVWCGHQGFDVVNIKFCDKCFLCGRRKFHLREWSWNTGPGTGRFGNFCDNCWEKRPRNWEEKLGITTSLDPKATFVRYIGISQITAIEHGPNAYGSILAEYSDGSRTGVICGHGGSAWLCLDCAKKIVTKTMPESGASTNSTSGDGQ